MFPAVKYQCPRSLINVSIYSSLHIIYISNSRFPRNISWALDMKYTKPVMPFIPVFIALPIFEATKISVRSIFHE